MSDEQPQADPETPLQHEVVGGRLRRDRDGHLLGRHPVAAAGRVRAFPARDVRAPHGVSARHADVIRQWSPWQPERMTLLTPRERSCALIGAPRGEVGDTALELGHLTVAEEQRLERRPRRAGREPAEPRRRWVGGGAAAVTGAVGLWRRPSPVRRPTAVRWCTSRVVVPLVSETWRAFVVRVRLTGRYRTAGEGSWAMGSRLATRPGTKPPSRQRCRRASLQVARSCWRAEPRTGPSSLVLVVEHVAVHHEEARVVGEGRGHVDVLAGSSSPGCREAALPRRRALAVATDRRRCPRGAGVDAVMLLASWRCERSAGALVRPGGRPASRRTSRR